MIYFPTKTLKLLLVILVALVITNVVFEKSKTYTNYSEPEFMHISETEYLFVLGNISLSDFTKSDWPRSRTNTSLVLGTQPSEVIKVMENTQLKYCYILPGYSIYLVYLGYFFVAAGIIR